jgi:hypothetical protein
VIEKQTVPHEFLAADFLQAALSALLVMSLPEIHYRTPVMDQTKCHVMPAQRDTPGQPVQVAELGPLGPHELSSGRRVVEEITDLHRGAARMGGRLTGLDVAPFGPDPSAGLLFAVP